MDFFESSNVDIANVWNIEDSFDFVNALDQIVLKKCDFGENMQALSAQETIFFVAVHLQAEVNNGGFDQFFNNSTGNFSSEIVNAFIQIGAHKTADICQKALCVFGQELPADWTDRQKLLEEICSDDTYDALEKCDDAFFANDENLDELFHAYALKNRKYFE